MDSNSTTSLDLYAKVEDLLGVKEYAPRLYAHYLLFLNTINFNSLLDVGCGSGDFLVQMKSALDIDKVKGIDLSPIMITKTIEQGIDAECIDLCAVDNSFDIITAVFDMLNYLDKEALQDFLNCVKQHLKVGGHFLCDLNTLYGFENVAVGSYIVDDNKRFLTVDSDFEDGKYFAEFTLFETLDTQSFSKSQETIEQYYHTVDELEKLSGLELVVHDDVNLYELGEIDKCFVVFKKV